jgi:hypothetical protein
MSNVAPIPTPVTLPLAPPGLLGRLSVMMFLQYAIQGAWLPVLFAFLQDYRKFPDGQLAWLGAAGAVGAVVSPFLAGQVADRYLNAERFMCVAHLAGAVIVWLLSEVTGFWTVLALAFLYGALYTPTLAVGNAIAFAHLPDRDRDFRQGPGVGDGRVDRGRDHDRPVAVPDVYAERPRRDQGGRHRHAGRGDDRRVPLSAVLGVIQAVYCLTLPKTPPDGSGGRTPPARRWPRSAAAGRWSRSS